MIRTVIADDEPLAREGLRARIASHADIALVGEAANGFETVETVSRLAPELLFLDVRMPGLNGLDVLDRVPSRVPAVVLVTAHDRYAVKAFEVAVLDFLLKPISDARFGEALDRVRRTLRPPASWPDGAIAASTAPLTRFAVKDRDRFILLKPDQIDWIHSAANYAELHSGARSYLIRMTMHELSARLDPSCFVRIHRSTIVNADRIAEIRPQSHGEFQVLLRDGTWLRLGRRYRRRLLP
jgi:two-component system, LytTR family, response regulator